MDSASHTGKRPATFPVMRHSGISRLRAGLLLWGPLVVGCGSEPPEPDAVVELPAPPAALSESMSDSVSAAPGAIFDRQLVFLSTAPEASASDPDSLVIVPWLFRAAVAGRIVRHTQSVWFSQGGQWEELAIEGRDAPLGRTPWRVLPGERVRLVVGPNDRIESLVYRDPPRELETVIGDLLADWERPDGVSIGVYEATTTFPSGSVPGVVLDLSRRWRPGAAAEPGDWIFAYGGTDLQLFIQETPPLTMPRDSADYRGWTRLAFRNLPWEGIEMAWAEVRPFERARRDIPVSWSFRTPGGALSGRLESASSLLEAGEGDGPILPARGFFTVSGTVQVEGESFQVVGLVRHIQR